ncbi:cation:proton antiporter [Nocardia sp. 004]|uniref:cation:proton antiporter n=1 Tax=Nocardia sp. 004 TaxID=3385978 RepID=UPI0039A06580
MTDTALALIELGAVFLALGMMGRIAARVGMSPIPLYLLGGVAFGQGGVLELRASYDFGHVAGEIGVVLLLLLLGLEYTATELMTGLRRSWPAGLLDIALNATPGAVAALLLGWGIEGAITMAGITYISSSGIVAKMLDDLGRLGNRETPVVLSILVFEDLAMAVYLPILTTVLAGLSWASGMRALGVALLTVTLVLVVALRYGRHVSAVVVSTDREVFLLTLLGAALLVAGIASVLSVSAAVGAFLLGIAISGSTAHAAAKLLEPLRDLFAAIFFVAFGLSTELKSIPPVLSWAIALAVITLVTKVATGWWAAARQGVRRMGRARAGAALVARGEFSIVIAGLAVSTGAIDGQLTALTSTYVLLMAVLGPIAARVVEPVAGLLPRARPEPVVP